MAPPEVRFPAARSAIGGVPIADLVAAFGTPTYVYDAARIEAQIDRFKAFDTVRYAQKANSNLAILDLVRRKGVLVDAVSAGEIHRAELAGYSASGKPAPIVFTADIFDRDSLEMVLDRGVAVNCGSPDMIDQYGERVPGGEITLRINPGFGHGHSRKTNTGGEHSKHGIWHADLEDAVMLADKHGLRVTGIHMHIGSGVDFEHLAKVSAAAVGFARRVGSSVRTLSAGGGLPTPYREEDPEVDIDAYFAIWDRDRKALEETFGHAVELEIEPGRFLTAEAGSLLTEIRATKEMGSNTFYLVDAGFNNLARPILYGSHHPISLALDAEEAAKRSLRKVVVGGPLCESGDIFTQDEGGIVRSEPVLEARVGEILTIECAGAYGFVMSSNYNSKPFAAEVLVRDGNAHLVRRRETVEDLVRGESIPEA